MCVKTESTHIALSVCRELTALGAVGTRIDHISGCIAAFQHESVRIQNARHARKTADIRRIGRALAIDIGGRIAVFNG